jgi:hypothetical protein
LQIIRENCYAIYINEKRQNQTFFVKNIDGAKESLSEKTFTYDYMGRTPEDPIEYENTLIAKKYKKISPTRQKDVCFKYPLVVHLLSLVACEHFRSWLTYDNLGKKLFREWSVLQTLTCMLLSLPETGENLPEFFQGKQFEQDLVKLNSMLPLPAESKKKIMIQLGIRYHSKDSQQKSKKIRSSNKESGPEEILSQAEVSCLNLVESIISKVCVRGSSLRVLRAKVWRKITGHRRGISIYRLMHAQFSS